MAVSPRGHPYADPAERVRDWPATSQSLALVLDSEMATYGGVGPVWGAAYDPTKRVRLHIAHLSGTSSALGNISTPWPQPAANLLGFAFSTPVTGANVVSIVSPRTDYITATDLFIRTSTMAGVAAATTAYNVMIMAWWQAVAAG